MKLVLTHDTALQLLRANRERGGERFESVRVQTLDDCARSLKDLESFALPPLVDNTQTIHLLVASASAKQRSKTHVCHIMTGDVPRGAFCKVGQRVYTASPELIFVQAANTLSFVDLILFGLELCGTYTLRSNNELGFFNCPAVTTKEKLTSFAQSAQGTRGASTALKALQWVVNGSNSPLESCLMLFLCLPIHRGGYGLPLPDLNPRTTLDKHDALALGQSTMRCDLHWVKQRVAVEYNSSMEHLTPIAAARDAQRSNTLQHKSINVITVTPQIIANQTQFDSMVRQLCKALNVRFTSKRFLYSKERRELRPQLFFWLH